MNDEPLLWNARQAAKALGISDRTLFTLTKSGDVPHIRIGRRIMYPRTSLVEWIEQRSAGRNLAARNGVMA
jgi:excisionase family DNA binding protein